MRPIYVLSIAKNEEQFVSRWVESAQGADGIFMLDTGSTDNTVELARSLGVTVFEQTFTPWRFDTARNYLLDKLDDGDAWLINLDMDEILVGDWVNTIKSVPLNFNRLRYKYVWSWDGEKEGLVYQGDKIVRRGTHRWKHPVHEVNVPKDGVDNLEVHIEGFEIHHHPDSTKSRGQYLPLLLLSVDEDPEDDRNTYYCARELYFAGHNDQAIALFKRHLTMDRSQWAPERAYSMRYLAKMLPDERESWLLRAVAEYDSRETWLDLAKYYYDKQIWNGVRWAAIRCLRHQEKPGLYLNEAEAWGARPYDLAALGSYYTGMYDDALHYGELAVEHEPNDQRLQANLFFYKNEGTFNTAGKAMLH